MLTQTQKFLRLLARQYPNVQTASTEIINLNAILNLPKGTEHFMSDLHGENEAFEHIMRNGSGVIKKKIDEQLGTQLTAAQRRSLATLIYYPTEKLNLIKQSAENLSDWYKVTFYQLVDICRVVASKYTRSKVRKALPKDFQYIIEELLHEHQDDGNKQLYYAHIISTIIETGRADAFIIELCHLIRRLAVDRLHIIGDIFDRGPGAAQILDRLMTHHNVDVQWGNHDVVWMGAAAGSLACIATVVRSAARYNNLDTIEDDYGISLRPLVTFALDTYSDDPCTLFRPAHNTDKEFAFSVDAVAKLHKAITIISFKLEGQLISRHPEYQMDGRLLLPQIDFEARTVTIDGKIYPMKDAHFPTVDPKNPCCLTPEEADVMARLKTYFLHSGKLQKHVRFLYAAGTMYLRFNGNLLYHGCIPIDTDSAFLPFASPEGAISGKALLDYADRTARRGYFLPEEHPDKENCRDFLWYLWCGPASPLFGKDKMATFEIYFLDDAAAKKEQKNEYYARLDDEALADRILTEFGLDPAHAHIINGHVPVEGIKGESPIKADGKLFIIDGGLSKSYQAKTGIAGYTLISNSYGLLLTSHQPFSSSAEAVANETDIHSTTRVIEKTPKRIRVADTDVGAELREQIADLEQLLEAYRNGTLIPADKKK